MTTGDVYFFIQLVSNFQNVENQPIVLLARRPSLIAPSRRWIFLNTSLLYASSCYDNGAKYIMLALL